MSQNDKKFQKAKTELTKLLKKEIPSGRIIRLIENDEISKSEVCETLERYGYEWTGREWELSRPQWLKNAIKPQWLKNAIKQFENDLQGDGLHSFYKYYMLTFIFPGEKEDRIDLFRDYLANMELLTESTVKKLSEYVAPTINEEPTTAYDQYELETWLAYEYDIWVRQKELAGNFVYVLRNSFFVNLCSFLETHLVDLSSSEARSSIVITAVKSLVGELIKKVPEWEMIMHYIDIRNCIVHSDGFLNESSRDKKIRDFSSRTKNLLIRENKVILEKGFCEDATETVSRFLRKLDIILIDIK